MGSELKPVIVRNEDAQAFAEALLQANGVSESNATIIARGLVQADLRGVDSHGINRLPSYLSRVRNSVLDPKAEPTLTQVTPVVALVSQTMRRNMKTSSLPNVAFVG
jgi:LDH2 family malate/lactate/ureidoglycolate dehydrogenase